ncbi:ABC transporter substrate-binding protein [Ruminiclostridium cellulolyticum]|uniref:Extracellular solute-binding protein family 1 n=1 Tax=Ruminiclostridium cellulolyticum (strain ATCC 35319 / DSM 5812 / JCM 6584 / H10) TaxID=394503 RepID=B8I427_RUMCH|nr:extracellular solute-binding protein [Ruminiclostridium cellulolyticum]ACL76460.1 extracellular solute-binding protein family 1 [Ruminiclostridium cellulolyticum H10]
MQSLKKLLCLVLFTLVSIISVSCSSDNSYVSNARNSKTTQAETSTISLMTSWGGVDSKAGCLMDLLDRFENGNPSIKVSNQSIFGDEYLPTLKTRFASGNEPDVFGLWPCSDIKYMIMANKLADLTDMLTKDSEWMDSFKGNYFDLTTYNNRIYGIPFELVFEGMFINKDLFQQFNVKIPQNYEELKNAINIFNKHNITPIAYNATAEGSYIYQNMIASLGGNDGVENYMVNNQINKCYIDAMKYMKELHKMHAFPTDLISITSEERNNLFIKKQAAMIVQGSWFAAYFGKFDKTVEMIPFPSMGNGNRKIPAGLGGGTFYISKSAWGTPNSKENTVKLLKFLTSKETSDYLYKESGLFSTLNISRETPFNALAKQSIDIYENTPEQDRCAIPDHVIDRSTWEKIIVKEFPDYLDDKISAEQIWEKALDKLQ